MSTPAPYADPVHVELQAAAARLAAHLAPKTRAYHEIWLNGEKLPEDAPTAAAEEPMYGKAYLPRKFKTGLALPEDNSIDVYGQDLGLLAVIEGGRIVGYQLPVRGGI